MSKNTTSTKPGTDWAKLATMPDDEIDTAGSLFDANDPDAIEAHWNDAVVTAGGAKEAASAVKGRGPQKTPKKVLLSLRYSPEVVEYFRSTGKGWQSRMDDVLKSYVASH